MSSVPSAGLAWRIRPSAPLTATRPGAFGATHCVSARRLRRHSLQLGPAPSAPADLIGNLITYCSQLFLPGPGAVYSLQFIQRQTATRGDKPTCYHIWEIFISLELDELELPGTLEHTAAGKGLTRSPDPQLCTHPAVPRLPDARSLGSHLDTGVQATSSA